MKLILRAIAGILILTYLVLGTITLSHYGVNWDESTHSIRGQAYLYYFLTGKKHYDQSLFREGNRHSFYQSLSYDFEYQMKRDGDHPVVSDILSSFFNYIFYQKLGLIGDFEAYHLYGVVLVTIFLVFTYAWVEKFYGGFAAIVSVLSLVLYPLFYGESHYNVQKDIPEAVFLTLAALSFYIAFLKRSPRWMLLTGILAGVALGTKLNVIFLGAVVGMWLALLGWRYVFNHVLSASKVFRLSLFLIPIIAFGIFFISWPWLWKNPINNIFESLGYYRSMGITRVESMPSSYYFLGFSTYAVQWIVFTTPLVILALTFVGIGITLIFGRKEKHKTSLYILLLFLVPIIRVSLPHTSIYGGVRQIMEYIPPMAILAGIGASFLLKSYKRYSSLLQIAVFLSFIPITLKMISMHPNESVYFNSIIGGFKGAAARNIPGWGNSLGSTYRQGVKWLNTHAEEGARVTFAFELMSSIPESEFRPDIQFSNIYRSGPKREGEYIIGVTHEGGAMRYFNYRYVERFLLPVYEVVVDGVSVLKVWENDLAHTNPQILQETQSIKDIHTTVIGDKVIIEFQNSVRLMNITINFPEQDCVLPENGLLLMSPDGISWLQAFSGNIFESAAYNWFKPHSEAGKLRYIFAADQVQYLKFTGNDETSCLRKYPIRVEAEGIE